MNQYYRFDKDGYMIYMQIRYGKSDSKDNAETISKIQKDVEHLIKLLDDYPELKERVKLLEHRVDKPEVK